MRFRIGVDIGGTFTDLVVIDDSGKIGLFKVSSRENPADALIEGLGLGAQQLGLTLEQFMTQIDLIVHGTTVATNAVISRSGPTTGLITTKNFRDVLVLRDSYKWDRWNVKMDPPKPFVPRRLTVGVEERTSAEGVVLTKLHEAEARKAIQYLKSRQVKAVAVCFLWSVSNDTNERRMAELLAQEAPDMFVSISSEVQPVFREWPRACATVLNAYLQPIIREKMSSLIEVLRKRGYRNELLVVQSNGGATPAMECTARPVYLIMSGPSMASICGQLYARTMPKGNVITIDMGGTSFDVCMITSGSCTITKELRVEDMPTGVASVEVNSIGAGGGSIAWIDAGGALRVGPKSAGSWPGPACYRRGGRQPTVTDANVVLGYLNPVALLGGRMSIDPEASRQAIDECVAKPLGLSVERAAYGIFSIVNQNMVAGIEQVSIRRGLDPREYVLVVAGGAGPVHGGDLARELGIKHCLVPKAAGQFCALGLAMADIRHEFMESYGCRSGSVDSERVRAIFARLERRAMEQLLEEGVPQERIRFERTVDARYPRQINELAVPVPSGEIDNSAIAQVLNTFHDIHERVYTYSMRESSCEFLTWRLTAIGLVDKPSFPILKKVPEDPNPAFQGRRNAYFEELGGFTEVPVYDGSRTLAGMCFKGPAVIEEAGTTIVVWPSFFARVTDRGDYEMNLDE